MGNFRPILGIVWDKSSVTSKTRILSYKVCFVKICSLGMLVAVCIRKIRLSQELNLANYYAV